MTLLTALMCLFFFAGRAIFAFIVYGDGNFVLDYALDFIAVAQNLPPEEKGWEITAITSGGPEGDTSEAGADWNAFMQSEVEKACELSLDQMNASIFVDQIMDLLNNRITDNLAKQVVAAAGGGTDSALVKAQAIVSRGQTVTEGARLSWKRDLLRVKMKREIKARDVEGSDTFDLLVASQHTENVEVPGDRVAFSIRGYTVARGLDGWPWELMAVPENVGSEIQWEDKMPVKGSSMDLDKEGNVNRGSAVEESKDEAGDEDRNEHLLAEVASTSIGIAAEAIDRDAAKDDEDSPAEHVTSNDESGTEAIAESMISLW